MRFSVNISMLFTEVGLLERFERAADAGFESVELWWPRDTELDALEEAAGASGVQVTLLNFDGGDPAAGDRGLLCDPDRCETFKGNVPVALELARKLGCRRLHALVGLERADLAPEDQMSLAVENVRWAAELAKRQNADVLIEPINRFDNGPYLVGTVQRAAEFIREVAMPNVRLQFDVYHATRTESDSVVDLLVRHFPLVGHVQLADVPGRGAPGTGAVDFGRILSTLDRLGYDGYVGLEYQPTAGETLRSLAWLPKTFRAGDQRSTAIGELVDRLTNSGRVRSEAP
jgi:hydroxypyruvate isomerase